MIPGGYGFEVLRFDEMREESLRDISKLPADVRIVRALSDMAERHAHIPQDWYSGGAPRPVYILICHRYCPRVNHGEFYQFTGLTEFLERYAELAEEEKKPLSPCGPDNQMPRTAWHRGAGGGVLEYVWHDRGGWVPRWTVHCGDRFTEGV